MASKAEVALARFQKQIGKVDGPGAAHKVEQKQINLFADATGDHQFIHVDPERAAKLSPYKVTIAHGFLTLSLMTHLSASVKASSGAEPYAVYRAAADRAEAAQEALGAASARPLTRS